MLLPKLLLTLLAIMAGSCLFSQTINRYDVVITEIMADPLPVVGLPAAEYIEIKNVSTQAINLSGWKLSDASSTATITANFLLQPDSLIIFCATSQVAAFSAYGKTLGLSSFPSLDNDGDVLQLRSPQNKIIHAVAYTSTWYANEAKRDGGWSLEMMDTKNPCGGKDNWKASTNNLGGTPGKINSVNGSNPDATPPQLKRAYAIDNQTSILIFDEPLDSATASRVQNYSLPGFTILSAIAMPPLFETVQLKLSLPLQNTSVYKLEVNNIVDCKGNTIGAYNKIKIGWPQMASWNDIVVNEILFNPKAPGSDYVELYNTSYKIIDGSTLYMANRNTNGLPANLKRISAEPFYIFPGDYIVVTDNSDLLKTQYLVKDQEALLELASMPSYPDDEGDVVILNIAGTLIDEVRYNDKWHFGLINNTEGIALERIDPLGKSDDKMNWHSAATSVGYGTPTYKNSQYKQTEIVNASVELSSKIFSPDNDGLDDVLTIHYKVEESGYVANVIVFDAGGRVIKSLVHTALLGLSGKWNWDGLNDSNNKLPIGTYIVLTEIFNGQGEKMMFKNAVVLARKLN